RNIYVGNDAMRMRGVLKVKHPIDRGAIMDWNDYFEILNYVFYSLLRIENLSEYPVLYTEYPFMPRDTKEYIARVFYETHRVKSLIMVPTPILSIFSVGLTTGLVIESGDGMTWVCPIVNGQIIDQAVQKLTLAGTDVNQYLKNLLMREGINIESSAVDEIIRDIKEKNCYFSLDPSKKPNVNDSLTVSLPDGTVVKIPNYIFSEAPEVLFQPQLLGYSIDNVSQAVITSLQGIDNHYWSDLLSHVVISGGNLSYSGFDERFSSELNNLLPELGKIPKPKEDRDEGSSSSKLKPIKAIKKNQDTCPHCGIMVDLSDGEEFCPSCGGRVTLPELSIEIGGGSVSPVIVDGKMFCPKCNKEVADSSSIFCPYCGNSLLESSEVKEKEIKKLTPASEFSGYYKSTEGLLKFYVPENLQFAIFNGAAILGSLPSFLKLFVTHEEFLSNSDHLYRDISEIF
ncbi:MAG: zinc-ribbon domain-containing protein, partial [Promethearchaeota archaeon]